MQILDLKREREKVEVGGDQAWINIIIVCMYKNFLMNLCGYYTLIKSFSIDHFMKNIVTLIHKKNSICC